MSVKSQVVAGAVCVLMLCACSEQKAPADSKPAPSASAPVLVAAEVKIAQWGPNTTKVGQGFAQQANGNSALWFEQKGIFSPDGVEVWLGNNKLDNLIITPDSLGTVEVSPALLKVPGRFPLYLVVKADGKKIQIGEFEVTAN